MVPLGLSQWISAGTWLRRLPQGVWPETSLRESLIQPTAAGNYATKFAAISCTGAGEQIVNDGVAIRIETRVRDGRTIIETSNVMVEEANERQCQYGWIGIDCKGNWVMYCATEVMPCGAISLDSENVIIG